MKNIFALLFFFNFLYSQTVHFASPGTYTCLQDNGVSLKFTANNTSSLTAPKCGIKYNIDISSIVKCCKGKIKSAGKHPDTGEKLIWEYYR